MGKMGWETLRPRISKCHKEIVSNFSKDSEGLQIEETGLGDPGARNWQML